MAVNATGEVYAVAAEMRDSCSVKRSRANPKDFMTKFRFVSTPGH